jgi:hypothetical protein
MMFGMHPLLVIRLRPADVGWRRLLPESGPERRDGMMRSNSY